LAAAWTALREREAQVERRAQQVQIVLQDLQEQRERFDELVRQVAQEVKAVTKSLDQLAALESQAKKKQETDEFDRKNIDRLAAMFDSMDGEAAAPIIKQMADSGRMELAARILAQMKERNAARILAELSDNALAVQLVERVRALKYPNGAPGGGVTAGGAGAPLPREAGGITPAGGTPPRVP
jgi:flagellar motility protein MotE (MotC chaperone)